MAPRGRHVRLWATAGVMALALGGCPAREPARPRPVADAGADVADVAPRAWAEARPRFVKPILTTAEGFGVSVVGKDVFVARLENDRFRLARLDGDVLVDEESWSRGLPTVRKSRGTDPFACNRIGAIFGPRPERMWLIENAGGSHECSSTFGDYAVWRRANGRWSKDPAHSPPAGAQGAGELAAWPLASGVLGLGVSNLVGDTLKHPVEAMWTSAPDPWATRVRIEREGDWVEAACASAVGVLAVVSMSQELPRRGTITIVEPGKARRVIGVPPVHAPWGPCALREKQMLMVQPASERGARETWISFDEAAGRWTPIAIPWPYETRRIEVGGPGIVALVQDASRNVRVLLGTSDASSWTELEGLTAPEMQIVAVGANELLLHVDENKLVRVGL
jgi:hypothetical protein